MRMARSTLAAGPVICGVCDEQFTAELKPREPTDAAAPTAHDDADHTVGERGGHGLGPDASAPPVRKHSGQSPSEVEGLRLLSLAAESPAGVASLAAAGAWYHAWQRGAEEPIVAGDRGEAAAGNRLARALLKVDRTLTGEAVELVGREWMTGDRVIVGRPTRDMFDADGAAIPPPGVPGVVERVEADSGIVVVDFPIYGMNRFSPATVAAAALEYGYATVGSEIGASHVDVRRLDLRSAPAVRERPDIAP
jgi:hypothetical protein